MNYSELSTATREELLAALEDEPVDVTDSDRLEQLARLDARDRDERIERLTGDVRDLTEEVRDLTEDIKLLTAAALAIAIVAVVIAAVALIITLAPLLPEG